VGAAQILRALNLKPENCANDIEADELMNVVGCDLGFQSDAVP
jgi:hypothetical protein